MDEALAGLWPRGIWLDLSAEEIGDYLQLWHLVSGVELRHDVDDVVR